MIKNMINNVSIYIYITLYLNLFPKKFALQQTTKFPKDGK